MKEGHGLIPCYTHILIWTEPGIILHRTHTAEVFVYWLFGNGFITLPLRENHGDTLPLQFKDPMKWRFSLWKTDLCAPNYRRGETHEGPEAAQRGHCWTASSRNTWALHVLGRSLFQIAAWEIKCVMGSRCDKPSLMHMRPWHVCVQPLVFVLKGIWSRLFGREDE